MVNKPRGPNGAGRGGPRRPTAPRLEHQQICHGAAHRPRRAATITSSISAKIRFLVGATTADSRRRRTSGLLRHRAVESTALGTGYGQTVDICAGLGIDAMARAQRGQQAQAIELDPTRAAMLAHNARSLQIPLEVSTGDGLERIAQASANTLICADPDRRASGNRSVQAGEWLPDPQRIAELLPADAGCLLKLPPGCDWPSLQQQLPGSWRAIVLSVRNECKEIILEKVSPAANVQTLAITLDGVGAERFRWRGNPEAPRARCAAITGSVFIDPDPAIIRSRGWWPKY